MVLCMKLISFAWSAYDGTRPLEQLDATQKASRIEGVPGLLPFLGYACVPSLPASALIPQVDPHQHPRSFFFPSILAGPSFTYRSYDSFTSHRLFIKENPSGGADPTVIPPGRRRKAAKRFATGIFFLAIFSLYSGSLGMDKLIDPKFTAGKSWFEKCVPPPLSTAFAPRLEAVHGLTTCPSCQGPLHERRWFHRAHQVLLGVVHRVRPVSAPPNLSIRRSQHAPPPLPQRVGLHHLGPGLQPANEALRRVAQRPHPLDRVCPQLQGEPLCLPSFPPYGSADSSAHTHIQVLLDSWNMNTNVWLRECIYKRVAKKGRKPGCALARSFPSCASPTDCGDDPCSFKSTQITFITSALCVRPSRSVPLYLPSRSPD